jgi:filamentous hemagglutinin
MQNRHRRHLQIERLCRQGGSAHYLIETNPAFANSQQWLSSDYYFSLMGADPAMTQKRMGDGFYEQRLIREQLLGLTGKTVLDYPDMQSEYRALMEAGAAAAKEFKLAPGIGLNAAQVAQLQHDVVIMQATQVDGQSVLVPVVYLAPSRQAMLLPTGPLIAARNIELTDSLGITNSGTMRAEDNLILTAQSIDNRGGKLQSGKTMALVSQTDIDLTSAQLKAGSLILQAANNIKLNTDARQVSTTMQGGTRSSTQLGQTASLDITYDASIQTGGNFEQKGAAIKIGGNLDANIGGDWLMGTVQSSEVTKVTRSGNISGHSNTDVEQSQTSSLNVGGKSNLNVGHDFIAEGADIALQGGGSLNAGHDILLTTAKNSVSVDSVAIQNGNDRSNYGSVQSTDETLKGTNLSADKNLTLNANHDITLQGSNINVTAGAVNLNAGNTVNVIAQDEQHKSDSFSIGTHDGMVSSKTTTRHDIVDGTNAIAGSISGDTVNINAGKDLNIKGSSVVGTSDVNLIAKNNINIKAVQQTTNESHFLEEKKSGLMGSGGIGFTIGSRKLATTDDTQSVTNLASTVGSVAGNVNITAGKTYTQTGSDVLAPAGDINIAAQQVDIQAATDTSNNQQTTKFSQSGLTVAVTGGALNLAQNVADTAQGTIQNHSNRNKLLNALQTYANGSTLIEQGTAAVDAIKAGDAQGAAAASGIKVSISIGSSSSSSDSSTNMTTHQGSLVKAGGNVNINATKDDLTVNGSQISADKNITLDAAKNINLIASADTETNRSQNKSSSTSVGVSLGVGSNGFGLSLDVAASRGKGNANSDSTTYNNTQVAANETLTLKSGNDTNLIGANASGKQVIVDVGTSGQGNLSIESLQDVATSQAKQSNSGFAISIPIYGAGSFSGSVSNAKQNSNSNYQSVYQQSGIKASDAGFDINVQGNTDLKGAVVDSTATHDKNHLATNTLTVSDLQNKMDAKADSSGTTLSSDMLTSKYAAAKGIVGSLMNNGNANVSDSSTTLSAIADGTVIVESTTTKAGETLIDSNGMAVNRDTTNTNRVLAKPDIAALQQQAQQQQADSMLIVNTATAFTNKINKAMTADKKIILQKCDAGRTNCTQQQVEAKDVIVIGDKVYIFNNGILNNEEYALANAAQQSSDVQNKQGVYVIINPHTGDVVSEVLYAGWDKLNEALGGILPISNASEANIDIRNIVRDLNIQQAAQASQTEQETKPKPAVIDEIDHSRGTLTGSNATAQQHNDGQTDVPLGNVLFNGGAANAQNMSNMVDQVTNHRGTTQQATHVDDWVGGVIGGNAATGGVEGVGMASHSSYTGFHETPSKDENKMTDYIWGAGKTSVPVVVPPQKQKTNSLGVDNE